MNIKMTSVFVSDPIDAHKYNTDILGFQSFMFMPEMQLAIVVSSNDPKGTALLLEPNASQLAKDYQNGIYEKRLPAIVLGSDDLQTEFEKLAAKGVNFIQEPTTTDWGVIAMFDDTCGNIIQIHQDL